MTVKAKRLGIGKWNYVILRFLYYMWSITLLFECRLCKLKMCALNPEATTKGLQKEEELIQP